MSSCVLDALEFHPPSALSSLWVAPSGHAEPCWRRLTLGHQSGLSTKDCCTLSIVSSVDFVMRRPVSRIVFYATCTSGFCIFHTVIYLKLPQKQVLEKNSESSCMPACHQHQKGFASKVSCHPASDEERLATSQLPKRSEAEVAASNLGSTGSAEQTQWQGEDYRSRQGRRP